MKTIEELQKSIKYYRRISIILILFDLFFYSAVEILNISFTKKITSDDIIILLVKVNLALFRCVECCFL